MMRECALRLQKRINKNRRFYGSGRKKYDSKRITGLPIRGLLLTNYQIPVIVYEQVNGDRLFVLGDEIIDVVSREGTKEVALW